VKCLTIIHGKALSKEDAKSYGEEHGLVFLEGQEIVERYSDMGRFRIKILFSAYLFYFLGNYSACIKQHQ